MSGDLIASFRLTLAKIAEIEQRMTADQRELVALRNEVDEIRRLLRVDADQSGAMQGDAQINRRAPRKRPIHESSSVGAALRVLRMAGGPMHVNEIIKNFEHMTGVSISKATLVSNLSRYAVAKDTFKRTGRNTYALIDEEEDKELRLVG